jgi:hypothetical protein
VTRKSREQIGGAQKAKTGETKQNKNEYHPLPLLVPPTLFDMADKEEEKKKKKKKKEVNQAYYQKHKLQLQEKYQEKCADPQQLATMQQKAQEKYQEKCADPEQLAAMQQKAQEKHQEVKANAAVLKKKREGDWLRKDVQKRVRVAAQTWDGFSIHMTETPTANQLRQHETQATPDVAQALFWERSGRGEFRNDRKPGPLVDAAGEKLSSTK